MQRFVYEANRMQNIFLSIKYNFYYYYQFSIFIIKCVSKVGLQTACLDLNSRMRFDISMLSQFTGIVFQASWYNLVSTPLYLKKQTKKTHWLPLSYLKIMMKQKSESDVFFCIVMYIQMQQIIKKHSQNKNTYIGLGLGPIHWLLILTWELH